MRLENLYNLIVEQFNAICDLFVKSNDACINELTENPQDNLLFQQVIEEVYKDSSLNKIINIKGKEITISRVFSK